MLTLKMVQERTTPPAPYAEAAYTVVQGRCYYLSHEQTPEPSAGDGPPVLGRWRTKIELDQETGPLMIHIGEAEMWQKVYVMNDAGKTIDVIV